VAAHARFGAETEDAALCVVSKEILRELGCDVMALPDAKPFMTGDGGGEPPPAAAVAEAGP
jgi:hypothetical protein